jgi:hypothetical protein
MKIPQSRRLLSMNVFLTFIKEEFKKNPLIIDDLININNKLIQDNKFTPDSIYSDNEWIAWGLIKDITKKE